MPLTCGHPQPKGTVGARSVARNAQRSPCAWLQLAASACGPAPTACAAFPVAKLVQRLPTHVRTLHWRTPYRHPSKCTYNTYNTPANACGEPRLGPRHLTAAHLHATMRTPPPPRPNAAQPCLKPWTHLHALAAPSPRQTRLRLHTAPRLAGTGACLTVAARRHAGRPDQLLILA